MLRRLILFCCAIFLAACSAGPAAFPTAGVTVQAFPHVEIFTLTVPATPVPSEIPTLTPPPLSDTPLPPSDTPVPTFTATALIQLAPPTATVGLVRPTASRPTRTQPPDAPTTAPPVAAIRFRGVKFVSARHDDSRPPAGAITTLSVEFTGSRPPFTLRHDNLLGGYNANGDGQFDDSSIIYTFIHFSIPGSCGSTVVGTITVTGGDGQTFTHDYFVPDAPCS